MLQELALLPGICLVIFGLYTAYRKLTVDKLLRYSRVLIGTSYATAGILLIYSSNLTGDAALIAIFLAIIMALVGYGMSVWLSSQAEG